MSNYSHGRLSNWEPSNGDTVEGHNFTQKYPHTDIGVGVTGLKFKDCNLVNCDIPADATVEGCNTTQISRCGHLNDNYTCTSDECEHMTSKDIITIDGEVVDTIYEYADKVVS